MDDRQILDEQIEYYRARAPEYDDWFFRRGRYDRGRKHQQEWLDDVRELEAAVQQAQPHGRVLELACGTGLWTRHLAQRASSVVAVDASPQVLQLNAARVGSSNVEYVLADLFQWEPSQDFDFVFFGFWLTHIPPERFQAFWCQVRQALRPGGSVFFADTARHPEVAASNHVLPDRDEIIMERKLNDGQEYRVVKVFYEPLALEERLRQLKWTGFVRGTKQFFIYGSLRPAV
jgi:SAM-dependent methyltransferase